MPLRYATTLCHYVMPQGMPQVFPQVIPQVVKQVTPHAMPQVIPKVMQPVMPLQYATTSYQHIVPLSYAINYSLPNLSKINDSSNLALDYKTKDQKPIAADVHCSALLHYSS